MLISFFNDHPIGVIGSVMGGRIGHGVFLLPGGGAREDEDSIRWSNDGKRCVVHTIDIDGCNGNEGSLRLSYCFEI